MRVLKKILRSWEDFISYGSFREIKEDSGVKGSADNIISGFQKMLCWLHKILSKMAQMISAAKDYARRALSDTVITREVQESSTTIMTTISAKETRRN